MTDSPPLVAGETLVDFVPETTAPLPDVDTFHRRAGGAPANVAVGLARLGTTPRFWTRLGTDPFGTFLAHRLAAEGLPDRFVERDEDAQTTLAFVSGAGAAPRFTFYRDGTADTRLQQGTVPDETLESTPWVHAGGVALADEPARSATLDLLDRAADAGCTVSFDPNVRPELWGNDAELATVCGWAVEATDVLIATPEELETLGCAGDDPAELARAATELGPHTVVLTLGDAGAIAVATETDGSADATDRSWAAGTATHGGYPVDAVDDTGAGDAFTAGLIDALVGGESLDDALAAANAVAAISTTERGAMAALPTTEAVAEFLDA